MATGKAVSGASCVFKLNGVEVGYATGVSAQETIEYAPIDVLGEIDVVGHEPIRRTVSMSASFVRIRLQSLGAKTLWPRGDRDVILDWQPMVGELVDQVSGEVLYTIDGLYPQTQSWQIQKGTVVTVNATFYARRMYNEQA